MQSPPHDVAQLDSPPTAGWTSRLAWLIIAAGMVLFLLFRIRLFSHYFGSADIAGIIYNADILLDGGLPYRETLEYKSPGAFFLFALIFKLAGRDLVAVQIVFALWLLIGAAAVWLAARALYGATESSGGRLASAGATALYLLSAGQFEYNYSAWMAPAYVWSFALLLLGLRNNRWHWHVLAGVVALIAFLLKSQAVVLLIVFPAVWLWASRVGQRGASWRAPFGWLGGAVLGALPLLIFYQAHDALGALINGLLPVSTAREYAGQASVPCGGLELTWLVLRQVFRAFPLAATLAITATVAVIWQRRHAGSNETAPQEAVLPQVVLLLAAVLAAGLGGLRFYGHYLIQYLPGLAILAAHPAAYRLMRRRGAAVMGKLIRVGAVLGCLVALIAQSHAVTHGRSLGYRAWRSDMCGRHVAEVGRYVRERTKPGDTIYVWGWSEWPVYYWADRRSPCPLYKELGIVTTFNTNSGFFPSGPIAFKPGPAADTLVAAFRIRPPAYFVYGNHYERINGPGRDPVNQFAALREIIEQDYVREAVFGNSVIYARKP